MRGIRSAVVCVCAICIQGPVEVRCTAPDSFGDLSSRTSRPRLSEVSQCTKIDLRVNLGCACLPMTQHFTDFTQRRSAAEHLCRESVAEQITAFAFRNDAGPVQGTSDGSHDCASALQPSNRGALTDE